jgi:hypothetical protein
VTDALLTKVEGPDATATLREECRETFAQLEKLMRDLHWYFAKPGFPADMLVSLGLHTGVSVHAPAETESVFRHFRIAVSPQVIRNHAMFFTKRRNLFPEIAAVRGPSIE